MPEPALEQVVRNLDARLEKVEQILPTLPTRDELHSTIDEAVAPLATRAELQEAVALLASKAELQEAVALLATKAELQEAVALLATKTELHELGETLRADMREEGERTRRHFDVVAERIEGHVRLLAEAHESERARLDRTIEEHAAAWKKFDRRLMRLEAKRRS